MLSARGEDVVISVADLRPHVRVLKGVANPIFAEGGIPRPQKYHFEVAHDTLQKLKYIYILIQA